MDKQLTLVQRDILLNKIEEQINNKKHYIIQKRNELKKKNNLNEFLENIAKDYNNFYYYILNEKQQQYKALEMLKDYLEDLMKTEGFLDSQLIIAKNDQKNVINEMKKIKNEINKLMEYDTKNENNTNTDNTKNTENVVSIEKID